MFLSLAGVTDCVYLCLSALTHPPLPNRSLPALSRGFCDCCAWPGACRSLSNTLRVGGEFFGQSGAACEEQYQELMRPQTAGASLAAVCDFVRACVRSGKLDVEVVYVRISRMRVLQSRRTEALLPGCCYA